ncbi:hypothetical protein ACFY5H_26355 [Streptomyces sp. NPDC013012]|uniref:hypothetical protein n=1 Tax=Streptomyces sp. NPDC013012 TaxID=3364860 RepID=UPI00369BE91D
MGRHDQDLGGQWSADTPLLTEVCYGQYTALRDSLTGCQPVWLATSSGPASCGE